MPLTAAQVAQAKTQKLFDGGGMFLELTPNGSKRWRLKYRFAGKENLLSLGLYPETSLKAAREARQAARTQLANGTDPSQVRKIEKLNRHVQAANTFESIATEWHSTKKTGWSDSHAQATFDRMRLNLFPWLGARALVEITAPEIWSVLRKLSDRGKHETARRCCSISSQVFDHAIHTGRTFTNPAKSLSAALDKSLVGHHPAILDPTRFGLMMASIYEYQGSATTRAALTIHALTFQRPNEVSGMAWDEIDFTGALWKIPSQRMKGTVQRKVAGGFHTVPLSKQALEVLSDMKPLTGGGALVFPSERGQGRSISENTCRQALRTMGFADQTPHGFRASARTMLREQLGFSSEVIERQLAHGSTEALGSAYDRTQFQDERVKMMRMRLHPPKKFICPAP